jgi:hypothetical protein
MLFALWKFWPTSAALNSKRPTKVTFLGIERSVSTDVRMFVIVALAGALGGLLHSTRSFVWYVGRRKLNWRWLPYYIVIRGGVFTGANTSPDINRYGFAAIAALVGLFSGQALAMLRKVAEDVFHQAREGADQAAGSSAPHPTGPGAPAEDTGTGTSPP